MKKLLLLLLIADISFLHATSYNSNQSTEYMEQGVQYPRPVDCGEVLKNGNRASGIYTVYPRNKILKCPELKVYCDMKTDGGGWTVIQRRGDYKRSEDYFFKDWKSYKEGFGQKHEDFWLGNDNIFAMTNQALYTARFDLLHSNRTSRYAMYDGFWIEDEDRKYKLHLGEYRGTAGNSMLFHNGQNFSTIDRNNVFGLHSLNLAVLYKSGWWHGKGGINVNINALYKKGVTKHTERQVVSWYSFGGDYNCLDFTEIKIRQIDFK